MKTTLIDWRTIPLPPLPALTRPPVIAIRPGETWCKKCGTIAHIDAAVACCDNPQPIRVTELLWPEEYRLTN